MTQSDALQRSVNIWGFWLATKGGGLQCTGQYSGCATMGGGRGVRGVEIGGAVGRCRALLGI
eukprot:360921-Chlamydomonas_euryale.AAC.1